jgi:hypothetical protein
MMLNSLRAVARFFQKTIGWNRIGVLLSIAIISIAAVVLFHMLRDIDTNEVVSALKATQPTHIAAAAFFVACGYFTLTFYDLFALRTIGRNEIPYRIAALTGSPAIRSATISVRPCSRAARCVIASIRCTDLMRSRLRKSASSPVSRSGWAMQPFSVSASPTIRKPQCRSTNCRRGSTASSASAMLAVLVSYVMWVWSAPREIGQGEWKVRLPSGPSTLLQICIGILDLGFCALAMYMLLPGEPRVDFVTIAVVFVSATLLGFASHAPGGLGVFDAGHARRACGNSTRSPYWQDCCSSGCSTISCRSRWH